MNLFFLSLFLLYQVQDSYSLKCYYKSIYGTTLYIYCTNSCCYSSTSTSQACDCTTNSSQYWWIVFPVLVFVAIIIIIAFFSMKKKNIKRVNTVRFDTQPVNIEIQRSPNQLPPPPSYKDVTQNNATLQVYNQDPNAPAMPTLPASHT